MPDAPINFGDKQYNYGAGYPAPFSIPETTVCRVFKIPADEDNADWLAVFMGAVYALTFPEAWQQFEGAITKDQAAARWAEMIDQAYDDAEIGCASETVPAPYWDNAEDSDDELPRDDQPWYGYVTDAEAPPDELTFVESAVIWGFTGFIAFATLEIGAYPAVVFNTLAKRWVMAFKKEDLGEIIRVIVDAAEVERVDTSTIAEGEIIRVTIVGDPDEEIHTIQLVQVS